MTFPQAAFAARYPGIPLNPSDRARRYVEACARPRAEEAAEAEAEADAIRDGQDAGDLDRNGDPIRYPSYP